MIEALLFSLLILLVIAVLPVWPHSCCLGYAPSGGLGVVLIILLIIIIL